MEKHSYYDVAVQRMKSPQRDDKKAEEVVKILDDMVLVPMMHEDPERYWAFRRAEHELYNGAHYDEMYAMWEVSQMHHKDATGMVHRGERWDAAMAQTVYNKYKAHLGMANMYDVYVAINGEWHDRIEQFKLWFGDPAKAEERVVESAIQFYFMDDDAIEDGKVWVYHEKMR